MIYLNSSAIRAVKYDPRSGKLEVRFTSGSKWYAHHSVPLRIYCGLINASSPGGYYTANIKGRYR